MKILQVIPVFSPPFGGPVTVVRSISKELAKRHEVIIYTTSALDLKHDSIPRIEEKDGYKVFSFPRTLKYLSYSYLFGQLNFSLDMMNAVKKNLRNFDIVHVHSWQQFPDILVHHYAMKYNIPYVLQVHGSIPRIGKMFRKNLYDIFFGYKILQDALKVIALNKTEAEQYSSIGVPEEKIIVIPNGIDLSQYKNLPTRGCFKRKYGIDEREKIILYLGRIHKIKGIDILVKAFADITRKVDNVKLVIIGPDDGFLHELKSLIGTLRIEDDILISSPLFGINKLEAYVDSDICVLPSRYETFPMSLLEAYACNKPVIASRVGGLKDIVIDGITGFLVQPENIKQMIDRISFLFDNYSLLREMGMRGKQLVYENYTIEKISYKLEKLYREVKIASTPYN